MNDFYQIMCEKGLSNLEKDDLNFTVSDIQHKAFDEINEKIELLKLMILDVSEKVDHLLQYTNYIKFDHEYYITLDDAIWEQKQRKKFLIRDLEAAHETKKRIFKNYKQKENRVKKEVIEETQKSDSLFYFLEL